MNKALKVAVLMGGPSEEYTISLKSGKGVLAALRDTGYEAVGIAIPKEISIEQARLVAREQLIESNADVAFIALHGTFGEDGEIQSVCEALDMAYTGSGVEASRVGMDKWKSRQCFIEAGIDVPESFCLPCAQVNVSLLERMALPWIVKPLRQGSSIGISKVASIAEIAPAVAAAAAFGDEVIVEQFVEGHELTVGVLGEEALPVVGIVPKFGFFDFAAKYTPGNTTYEVPAPIEPELAEKLQDWALRAHKSIGARHLSRTDFIVDRRQHPVVLEVNTIPGFTESSLLPMVASCVGKSYAEVCEQLVQWARQTKLQEKKLIHG